jgi:hypothetical protein
MNKIIRFNKNNKLINKINNRLYKMIKVKVELYILKESLIITIKLI